MLLMEEAVSRSDKAETGRMQEKRGYSVFGKEYEQMLRHDLHAENSIDHQLLRRMVLLEEDTAARLYSQKGRLPAGIQHHPLYDFAGHFAGSHQAQSIDHLLRLTKRMAENFTVPFEQMRFGGTEREILLRYGSVRRGAADVSGYTGTHPHSGKPPKSLPRTRGDRSVL